MELSELVNLANEINRVCEPNPPLETEFKKTATGAAGNSQEKKFIRELTVEVGQILSEQMENGVYIVQVGDIPKMNIEAKATIELVAPDQTERLFGVEKEIKQKDGKYTRIDSVVEAILNLGKDADVKMLSEESDKLYCLKGGKSSLGQATYNTIWAFQLMDSMKRFGVPL